METEACNEQACAQEELENVCLGIHMDVVLLIDASSAVSADHFEDMKTLATELVTKFTPHDGPDAHRVAIASYSNEAHEISPLTVDLSALQTAISGNLQLLSGCSHISKGLTMAKQALADSDIYNSMPVVVTLTHGTVVDPYLAEQAALELFNHPAHLVFVTIGEDISNPDAFERMASWPPDTHIIKVPDADSLAQNIEEVTYQVLAVTCTETNSDQFQII
jgi:hypothetical protein